MFLLSPPTVLFALVLSLGVGIAAPPVPKTVEATWADFDPKSEPLNVEIIKEWDEGKITIRHLRYHVATFGKKKTRVAAFYAFPKAANGLPGIVQIHGGGQFARVETVTYWASQGYAAIAINWGEKPIGDDPKAPNTDWAGIPAGFLDPKHHNDVTPGENTLHDIPHPWNSSWLLYSAAARRAITFLEEQPEADPDRIGLTGHSMGGRLTVLTAIDPRVKAASPSVGGSGYLYENINGIPNSGRHMKADRDLYLATLGCQHYWPLIQCPVLFLGATNDFNSPMEKVMQGFRSLPKKNGALSFTPHMNHRFTADNYAARVRWFDTHLKGTFEFPKPPEVILHLDTNAGIPNVNVRPDVTSPHKLKSVQVFYGFERDPRVRFWRSAEVKEQGGLYFAQCPVFKFGEPLFVFANVTYDTGETLTLPRGYRPSPLLTISSEVRQASPDQLEGAGVIPDGKRERLIDDFKHGWRDWSLVSPDNPHHFNLQTYKPNDPAFVGPRGAELAFETETTAPNNKLAVILETDQWRGYTGRKTNRYTALVNLAKAGSHSISLPLSAFESPEGEKLESYDYVTSLIFAPGNKELPDKATKQWSGKVPTFKNLRWEGGEFTQRPKPYLGDKTRATDPASAFREQFEREVKESVERESRDR